MSSLPEAGLQPVPLYHADSEVLRFWVRTGAGSFIGAGVSRRVLHHRFEGQEDGSDALAVYTRHRDEIDAAVMSRVATGSIEPVMLREHDLPRSASRT